jgi:inositol transport system substrate-binding protein
MKRKGTIFAVLIAVLAVLLILAGCGQPKNKGAGAETKKATIAVFVPDGGNAYYQNKVFGYYQGRELLKVEFPNYDVELLLYNAGSYANKMKQISQVEDAMTKGVNAMIVTACDSEALVPVVNEAMKKGLPVIADDVLVNTKTTMKISENSYRIGVNSAMYIARKLNGKGNVVLLSGAAGAGLCIDRNKGVHDELGRYPGIKILDDKWHDITIMEGRRIMEDWIQAYGKKIDAVWSTNSMVVTGACDALKDAGYKPGEVLVVSIDFSDVALKNMREGWIDGLIPAQPIKLARVAFMDAFYASLGRKIPETVYTTDDVVISREELEAFDQSDAMAPADWKPEWKS